MATIPGVSDNELTRTSWGNAVADELNLRTVKNNATQTMAGPLTVTNSITANNQVIISDTAPTAASHAARKDYVDSTTVSLAGDTMTGFLNVGGPATSSNNGVTVRTDGGIVSTVTTGAAPNSLPNLLLARTGTPAQDAGGVFARFERLSSGVAIGSITIASASAVAYNTTSDPRLKQQTGDVADAAAIVQDLGAKAYRGRWIADQGQGEEWVFLNSTDVEPVAPYAVSGAADATGPDGEIVPQQLDHGALVPLLLAALSQALDRIAALEAG